MEEELRCPACSCLYTEPLLLPCLHAVCLQCALGLQRPAQLLLTDPNAGHPVGHTAHDPEPPDGGDSDKGSVYSETDSGVVVASRPNSYLSSPEVVAGAGGSSSGSQGGGGGSTSTSTSSSTSSGNSDASDSSNCSSNTVVVGGQGVRCPSCRKVAVLGPAGLSALPRYTAMARIIARYKGATDSAATSSGSGAAPSSGGASAAGPAAAGAGGGGAVVGQGTPPPCQLCEGPPRPATTECQQCHVLYCGPCLASCHPARGPLATHTLGPVAPLGNPSGGGGSSSSSSVILPGEVCVLHGERPTLYCLVCSWSGCRDCGPLHSQHDLQPLDNIARTHKAELSESLQQMSERAKAAHAHITRLKTCQERISSHCDALAVEVDRQCGEMVAAVEAARTRLLTQLASHREARTKAYRDQTTNNTRRLHQTTALVQFCIEAIKEPDPAAFMQMGPQLIGRVSDLDLAWDKELSSSSNRLSSYIDLDLDNKNVMRFINTFNFIQMKPALDGEERKPAAPGPPEFLPEECLGQNNSVTATWTPHPTSRVNTYVLEIDDGDGVFKEVHRGPETVCTVEGLHFNTVYQLRVKAHNASGQSPYSSPVAIRTSDTAWFTLDRNLSHPECRLLTGGTSVTCESYEHRVALGSLAFSRGRHYWTFSIDAYNANADVVFGIARTGVNKEIMLGNDPHGWAMYIDHQRSWFLHGAAHHGRHEGGVAVGTTVGVLLDLTRGTLAFYVNDEPQGDVAFTDLEGLFYPAVSINRNVSVTLHTSLDPPSDYDSQSDT